jgi:glycosyltransferase involved in cell wall biosynthesis
MREKVTCIVGAKNAENDIDHCLESVKWADEIIVIDDFSADRTLEIAREYTDKVFQKKMDGYPEQIGFAVNKASNRWVLVLDADERVTPQLKNEILKILSSPITVSGFLLRRLNNFEGRQIKHCGWYEKDNLRLFNKEEAIYDFRLKYLVTMHISGLLGTLDNDLVHYTCRSLYDYFKRINLWSSLNAEDLLSKGVHINYFNSAYYLLLKPCAVFFIKYFLKAGYMDGFPGFLICSLSGITYFLSYMKLWIRQGSEKDKTARKIIWRNDPILANKIIYTEKELS